MHKEYRPLRQELDRLSDAISSVTMLDKAEWLSPQKGLAARSNIFSQEILAARIIYTSLCRQMRIPIKVIASLLGVNNSTISYYNRRYWQWHAHDERFKSLESAVQDELST